MLGGVLAGLYVATGSLLLPVLLHVAIDLRFLLVPSSALPGGRPVTDARARWAAPGDWPEVADLRHRVFVLEQGVPPELERDDADATAVHALSRDDAGPGAGHRAAAAGRRRAGRAVIGRMAADPAARGQGHGAAVLAVLQRRGRRPRSARGRAAAQVGARRFYERAGYAAVGGGVRGGRHRARDDASGRWDRGRWEQERSGSRETFLSVLRGRPPAVRGSAAPDPAVPRTSTERPSPPVTQNHCRPCPTPRGQAAATREEHPAR